MLFAWKEIVTKKRRTPWLNLTFKEGISPDISNMQDGNALFWHGDESLHPVIPHRCNQRSGSLSTNWEKERYIVRKSKTTRFLVVYSTRLPCSVMSISVLNIAHVHSR